MDCRAALPVAPASRIGDVVVGRLQQIAAAKAEALLAKNQPGFFAAAGELDWYSSSHRSWIDDIELHRSARVLEVGSATGTLAAYMADNGYRVTGIDRSNAMIARARNDHPELNLLVGDATQLPHDDGTFDAVVAASVINIALDAHVVLTEMRRVCVPGGTVSILVPATDFTNEDCDALVAALGLTGFSEAVLARWHRGPSKMSRPQLGALFRSANLSPVDTRSYLQGMLVAATATVR